MALFDALSIYVTYLQNLMILVKANIVAPLVKELKPVIMVFFNFDFTYLAAAVHFDFRMQFIFLCCIIPILITLLVLFTMGDVGSVFVFVFTTCSTYLAIYGYSTKNVQWMYVMYAFAVIFGLLALVSFALSSTGTIALMVYEKIREKEIFEGGNFGQFIKMAYSPYEEDVTNINTRSVVIYSVMKILKYILVAGICFIFVFFASPLLTVSKITGNSNIDQEYYYYGPQAYVPWFIFAVCIIMIIFTLIAAIVHMLPFCAIFLYTRRYTVHKRIIKTVFLLLSTLYIPIMTTVFQYSNACNTETCPPGTIAFQESVGGSTNVNATNIYGYAYDNTKCIACDATYACLAPRCYGTEVIQTLSSDSSIRCGSIEFTRVAVYAILVVYGIGFPLFVTILVTIGSYFTSKINVDTIMEEQEKKFTILSKLYRPVEYVISQLNELLKLCATWLSEQTGLDLFLKICEFVLNEKPAKKWPYQVIGSDNIVSDMYSNYEYRMRYFLVYELFMKFCITAATILLETESNTTGIGIMFGIHLIQLIVLALSSPYLVFLEDVIATLFQLFTVLNFLYGLISDSLQPSVYIGLLLLYNLISPIVNLIHMVITYFVGKITDARYTGRTLKLEKRKDLKGPIATIFAPINTKIIMDGNEAAEKVDEEIEETDKKITYWTYLIVVGYFVLLGSVTAVVLGFALLEISVESKQIDVTSSNSIETFKTFPTCSTAYEKTYGLKNYLFSELSNNCCCQSTQTKGEELWICSSENVLGSFNKTLLYREGTFEDTSTTGYAMRGFCDVEFNGLWDVYCGQLDETSYYLYASDNGKSEDFTSMTNEQRKSFLDSLTYEQKFLF